LNEIFEGELPLFRIERDGLKTSRLCLVTNPPGVPPPKLQLYFPWNSGTIVKIIR